MVQFVEQKSKATGQVPVVGCLMVAGGLALFALIGVAIWLRLPTFALHSYRMMVNATTAPGVQALKDSGCEQAAVTDLDELHRLGLEVDPKMEPRQMSNVRFNVACFVSELPKAPGCDDVARAYDRAPGVQPNTINAVVRLGRSRDSSRLLCSRLYAPDGRPIGDTPEVQ